MLFLITRVCFNILRKFFSETLCQITMFSFTWKKIPRKFRKIGPWRSTVSLDKFPCIIIFFPQVEVVAAFVQVEEVERISMEPWERVERVVRDFFREGWVGEPVTTMSLVGLGEEVGLGDGQGEEEEEEGTLGEVVVKPFRIPVAVEVGRSMLETTNIMIVVTTLQVMVR